MRRLLHQVSALLKGGESQVPMKRFPSKTNSLRALKRLGVEFGTVLDVGVHEQTPELRLEFPQLRHLLFEPASEFFPKIQENYAGTNYELIPAAVSNTDGDGRLKKVSIDGGDVSHSSLVWGDMDADVTVETIRLDTFLKARNEPKPYLLKVDVDGFELPILEGAEGIWDDISCIIVEATQTTFLQRMEFIVSRGFQLFDIIDTCYYYGVFSQSDLVFVSQKVVDKLPRLRPWETEPFTWDQWEPVAGLENLVNNPSES
jgi:FkbM family methyltransferase